MYLFKEAVKEENVVSQMLFLRGRYLELSCRSTQSALAYKILTVLLVGAGSISGPPLNVWQAESWLLKS